MGISPSAPPAALLLAKPDFHRNQWIPYLSMVLACYVPQSFIYQYLQESNNCNTLCFKRGMAQSSCKYWKTRDFSCWQSMNEWKEKIFQFFHRFLLLLAGIMASSPCQRFIPDKRDSFPLTLPRFPRIAAKQSKREWNPLFRSLKSSIDWRKAAKVGFAYLIKYLCIRNQAGGSTT